MKSSFRDYLLSVLFVVLLALVIGVVYELEKPDPLPNWHRVDHHNELDQLEAQKR